MDAHTTHSNSAGFDPASHYVAGDARLVVQSVASIVEYGLLVPLPHRSWKDGDDDQLASRCIENLALNLGAGDILLAVRSGESSRHGRTIVIDGLKRLRALSRFFAARFELGVQNPLRLQEMRVLTHLEGMTWGDMCDRGMATDFAQVTIGVRTLHSHGPALELAQRLRPLF